MNQNKSINDLLEFVSDNNSRNKIKKSKKKRFTLFIINIASITFLIVAGIGVKSYFDQQKEYDEILEVQKEVEKISSIEIKEPEIVEENIVETRTINFDELLKTNKDTVGWIKVPGTKIDLAVVQSSNNKYYLTHDFNKKYNSMGWAYADYRNKFPELSQNTILYGHTYKKTIIFSTLQDVLENSWLNDKEKQIIDFSTTNIDLKWEVFSIYTIKKTSDYLVVDFSKEEFNDYVSMIASRSIKDFNVDVLYGDKILTLSTCYLNNKTRLVVHAKLINPEKKNFQ